MMLLSFSGFGAAPDGTRGSEGEEGGLSRPRRARPEGLAPCGPAALGYRSGGRSGAGTREGEQAAGASAARIMSGSTWEGSGKRDQGRLRVPGTFGDLKEDEGPGKTSPADRRS